MAFLTAVVNPQFKVDNERTDTMKYASAKFLLAVSLSLRYVGIENPIFDPPAARPNDLTT